MHKWCTKCAFVNDEMRTTCGGGERAEFCYVRRCAIETLLPSARLALHPTDFKRWRKSLGLSQKDAAEALGLKKRVVQYYEKGERDGARVLIPKTVRLACYALLSGITDYHGPEDDGSASE